MNMLFDLLNDFDFDLLNMLRIPATSYSARYSNKPNQRKIRKLARQTGRKVKQ